VDGVIKDDSSHKFDVARAYPITEVEYKRLMMLIESAEKTPGKYNLQTNQCTSFAVNTIEHNTNINIPDRNFYYNAPPNLTDGAMNPSLLSGPIVSGPGTLGQDLSQSYGPPGSITVSGPYDPEKNPGDENLTFPSNPKPK
jgi:hypothetical protein